ncbi:MAG: hypothetical protein R3F14_47990, partial [Polyangiaceae bacterium]
MKMPSRTPAAIGLILPFILAAGCVAPWPALETCPEDGCLEGTETDHAGTATTISSVTIDPNSSSGSTSTTTGSATDTAADTSGGSTTDASPAAPPAVESVSLSTRETSGEEPLVIHRNGPILVDVEATDADGVRVELDDGGVIELAEEVSGVFRGEFPIVTALNNGQHTAKIVPYREDFGDGETATAPYQVDLPPMGEELFWKVDEYLGEAWVMDVAVLSNGDLLEFGTQQDPDNHRSCFLRRRNPLGAYGEDDIVKLLGGDRCEAVDVEVRDDQVFVLATWQENGDRWWLGHTPQFGDEKSAILAIAQGENGETATALDLRADGAAMVCGTTTTGYGDLDAFTWVWESGQQPELRTFDYRREGGNFPEQPHQFDEIPRDCLFVGENQAVLVGDAYGVHDDDKPDAFNSRRLILAVELAKDDDNAPPPFVIAAEVGPGNGAQSVATAADIDDQGRLLVTGYTCDESCEGIEGHFWVHDLDGGLVWFAPLGQHDDPLLAPRGVGWHPAGYAVVSNGGIGKDDAFMLRGL